jgi:hypothetical protein
MAYIEPVLISTFANDLFNCISTMRTICNGRKACRIYSSEETMALHPAELSNDFPNHTRGQCTQRPPPSTAKDSKWNVSIFDEYF